MPEFTPGEWKAKSNNPSNIFSWLLYNDNSRWPIAVEMKEADAKLMSASKEMYEALNLLYKLNCDGAFSLEDKDYIAITKAAAALHKAEKGAI